MSLIHLHTHMNIVMSLYPRLTHMYDSLICMSSRPIHMCIHVYETHYYTPDSLICMSSRGLATGTHTYVRDWFIRVRLFHMCEFFCIYIGLRERPIYIQKRDSRVLYRMRPRVLYIHIYRMCILYQTRGRCIALQHTATHCDTLYI